MTTTPAEPGKNGARIVLSLRIASSGHTLVHEGHAADYDPMKNPGQKDNPFTMIVIDGDRLLLTHFCDADNRPRMIGRLLPDGKAIDFEFLDVSGNLQYGHMEHVKFTVVDSDHHTEDWTWATPENKLTVAHFDVQRTHEMETGYK